MFSKDVASQEKQELRQEQDEELVGDDEDWWKYGPNSLEG